MSGNSPIRTVAARARGLELRSLWRMLPQSVRRSAWPAAKSVFRAGLKSRLRYLPQTKIPGPLVVSGFFNSPSGIGEGGRLTLQGLKAAGFDPIAHDLGDLFADERLARKLPGDGGVWIIHCNPPEAIAAFMRLDAGGWSRRHRIGYWAYELPHVPNEWTQSVPLFHEIWAPSAFVANAIGASKTPSRVMPHPVPSPAPRQPNRKKFGLADGAFYILAAGDQKSSFDRKNVGGVIDAYCKAFPEAARDTGLVLKLRPYNMASQSTQVILKKARQRSDITLLTEDLSEEDMRILLASCDLVFSPHRAEGFGLVLAEAMAMGIPALATNWSGNLEFMSGLDPLLVPMRLAPVSDGCDVYGSVADAYWAEPDISAAARQLQELRNSRELRNEMARIGADRIAKSHDTWIRTTTEILTSSRLLK